MENTSNKKDKIIRISILTILLLLIGVMIYVTISYAYWQKEYNQEKENTLQSGCFSYKFTDKNSINLENAYPMSESDAMKLTPYTFTIENNCSIDIFYNVTLNTTNTSELDSSLRYKLLNGEDVIGSDIISNLNTYSEFNNSTYTDESGDYSIINSYILDKGTLSAATMNDDNTEVIKAGENITYDLYLWIDENVDDIEIMAKSFEGKIIVSSTTSPYSNENIIKAYTYNQDSTAANYCVTGDEATCEETTCYKSGRSNSCPVGTIIDYKVNETEMIRFHVMYDNGTTLTMQSQKNTVYCHKWISETDYATANIDETSCSSTACNDEGPITILNVLESKTSNWKNVNKQRYTMGTTTFKTNSFTGCSSYNTCDKNTYTLDERTANARMITVQEATNLGCTSSLCPIWMYNYLQESTNYGGTINDTYTENGIAGNYAYWTMSALSSDTNIAWHMTYGGYLTKRNTFDSYFGARAVVEINK